MLPEVTFSERLIHHPGSEPAVGHDRDWFDRSVQQCMQDSLELTLAFDVVILRFVDDICIYFRPRIST